MLKNLCRQLSKLRGAQPPGRGRTQIRSRIAESPRIPVQLPSPSRLKSVSLSPLIDPNSPLSLPESDHERLKWLSRFTPRWNESKQERMARFKLRAEKMRTRRAHTERLLNSFQRLDGFTCTTLPSDLMISFSFSKWAPSPQDPPQAARQQLVEPARKSNKGREDGPGTYLTPNRILHPYWVSKKPGVSFWLLCHQDILKHRKKLRPLYRYTHEPKFSAHLADQVSSQLARRIAQECFVLKTTLGVPAPCTPTSLDDLVAKTTAGKIARISDYPTPSNGPVLASYLDSLLSRPSTSIEADDLAEAGNQHASDPAARIGAILVKSTSLFRQLEKLQPPKRPSPECAPADDGPASNPGQPQDTLIFSLGLTDGPIPVWDLEGLLNQMAKKPPRHASGGSLITAALSRSPPVSAEVSGEMTLAELLMRQIDDALSLPESASQASPEAYLIPLTEPTYTLILALLRATWWLGQGFGPAHFAALGPMVAEAEGRKRDREARWLDWVRSRNVVEGKIKRRGQLWIPEPRSGPLRKLWRRV